MLMCHVPDCDFCQNLHFSKRKIIVVHNSGKSIRLKPLCVVNFDALVILEVHIIFLVQNQQTVSDVLQGVNAEHSEIDDSSMPILNDASTQTDHCDDKMSVPSLSKPNLFTAQINEGGPLPPARPYQCYGRSMRTDIRSEIIKQFHDLLYMVILRRSVTWLMTCWSQRNGQACLEFQDRRKIRTSQVGFSLHWSMSTKSAKGKKATVLFRSKRKSFNRPSKFQEPSLAATLLFKVLHLKLSKHKSTQPTAWAG